MYLPPGIETMCWSFASESGAVVDVGGAFPVDQAGNGATNRTRTKPYDWLLVSGGLREHQVPTVIGAASFAAGLVFDSRVYTPLSDVPPVTKTDSDAVNMQHMPVVKDFHFDP